MGSHDNKCAVTQGLTERMSYGKFAGSHGPGYFVGADLNKSGLFRFGPGDHVGGVNVLLRRAIRSFGPQASAGSSSVRILDIVLDVWDGT